MEIGALTASQTKTAYLAYMIGKVLLQVLQYHIGYAAVLLWLGKRPVRLKSEDKDIDVATQIVNRIGKRCIRGRLLAAEKLEGVRFF